MRNSSYWRIPRGQAAVEAMAALVLLGALLHAVVILGASLSGAQQASNLSRVAAFANIDARGRGLPPNATVSMSSLPADEPIHHATPQAHHVDGKRADYATTLARDWLSVEGGLRQARVTLRPLDSIVSTERDAALMGLAVRRHTVISVESGYQEDDETVSHRIARSALGWGSAAHRSRFAAERVARRLKARSGRNVRSADWISARTGATPSRSPIEREDD